ncbi:hypothetical protein [Clostridium magnum]
MCNIPIKTLRYYDEIELLIPRKIDNKRTFIRSCNRDCYRWAADTWIQLW